MLTVKVQNKNLIITSDFGDAESTVLIAVRHITEVSWSPFETSEESGLNKPFSERVTIEGQYNQFDVQDGEGEQAVLRIIAAMAEVEDG